MFQGRIFQYSRIQAKPPGASHDKPTAASRPPQADRRKPTAASRPPQADRRSPTAAARPPQPDRRALTLTLTLTLTLFHAHVMHVSLFGKFAYVGVSCSSPSSPRPTLSLLYCDSCPRHSSTLRSRLIIAQRQQEEHGGDITELATFFRP